jgi:HEAT repeat protein
MALKLTGLLPRTGPNPRALADQIGRKKLEMSEAVKQLRSTARPDVRGLREVMTSHPEDMARLWAAWTLAELGDRRGVHTIKRVYSREAHDETRVNMMWNAFAVNPGTVRRGTFRKFLTDAHREVRLLAARYVEGAPKLHGKLDFVSTFGRESDPFVRAEMLNNIEFFRYDRAKIGRWLEFQLDHAKDGETQLALMRAVAKTNLMESPDILERYLHQNPALFKDSPRHTVELAACARYLGRAKLYQALEPLYYQHKDNTSARDAITQALSWAGSSCDAMKSRLASFDRTGQVTEAEPARVEESRRSGGATGPTSLSSIADAIEDGSLGLTEAVERVHADPSPNLKELQQIMLGDERDMVRLWAAWVLGEINDPQSMDVVTRALPNESHPKTRVNMMWSLFVNQPGMISRRLFLGFMADGNEEVRRFAARFIASTPKLHGKIDFLSIYRAEPEATVRLELLRNLGCFRYSPQEVTRFLDHELAQTADPSLQAGLMAALAKSNRIESADIIEKHFHRNRARFLESPQLAIQLAGCAEYLARAKLYYLLEEVYAAHDDTRVKQAVKDALATAGTSCDELRRRLFKNGEPETVEWI